MPQGGLGFDDVSAGILSFYGFELFELAGEALEFIIVELSIWEAEYYVENLFVVGFYLEESLPERYSKLIVLLGLGLLDVDDDMLF